MGDQPPRGTVGPPRTRAGAVAIALAALDGLVALGETVEDEWTYVTALADAGRARIRAAAGAGAPVDTALPLERGIAVAAAAEEAGRISDPHRAIDWLSTLPAIVELAFGSSAPPDPGSPVEGGDGLPRPGTAPGAS